MRKFTESASVATKKALILLLGIGVLLLGSTADASRFQVMGSKDVDQVCHWLLFSIFYCDIFVIFVSTYN